MDGIKSTFRKLNYKIRHSFFSIQNVVLIIAIILCLVWTYQSIVAMTRNWKLQETLSARKKELELLTIELETLELENEYYKTEEYQELLARKYLDKKIEGENLVILPENSELAKMKHQEAEIIEKKKEKTNFEKWMKFLLPDF